MREPDWAWRTIATPLAEPVDAGFDERGRWWLLSMDGTEAVLLEEQ